MRATPSPTTNFRGFHQALVDLYDTPQLRTLANDGQPSFSDDIWQRLIQHIFAARGFNPDMLSDAPVRAAIDETYRVLSHAVESQLQQDVPQELVDHLLNDTFLFSGFKTYHEAREVSALLLNTETGTFKSFEKILEEVRSIDQAYNHNYLQAEYNFAVQSTQMAVRWHDFEQDGDRYNLQYRTANDDHVRPEHQALHNTTLPISDPFWNSYTPPLGWNCRCTVVQVLTSGYPLSDSDAAIRAGEAATAKPKQQIFRFNPGKTQRVFPPKHPYLPKGCGDCQFRAERRLGYKPDSPLCQACNVLASMIQQEGSRKLTAEERLAVRQAKDDWIRLHMPFVDVDGLPTRQIAVPYSEGENILVRSRFFNETFAKNIYNKRLAKTIEIATHFEDWMPNMIEQAPEKGKHHDCTFRVFETSYEGYRIQMKAMETKQGTLAYTMRIMP